MANLLHLNKTLPESFKPLFWSYDFSSIDTEKQKKSIIIQIINYGNLEHWEWLVARYGIDSLREILSSVSVTEIKPRTRELVSILFSIHNFHDAPRGLN